MSADIRNFPDSSTPAEAGGAAYARREQFFRPSPVRAVFETAMRPDVVSLAGGNPDLSFLPLEFLADLAAQASRDRVADVFQYGSGAGTDALRDLCVDLMTWGNAVVERDNVQIVSGSQAGLDAVTKVLCDPGDAIIVEGPTYVGALGIFGAYEVEVHHVELDAHGLDPAAVGQLIAQLQGAGKRVRYVYTIPTHSNPAGVSLSRERRRELVEICAAAGVWIIEDDAYGLINFPAAATAVTGAGGGVEIAVQARARQAATGAQPLARSEMLLALNPQGVIHLGSFSKIFSPGLRLGWVAAPAQLRRRLQIACESVCITPSVLSQYIAQNYVGTPLWADTLTAQCRAYALRYQHLARALRARLGEDLRFTQPTGGFFTWIDIPAEVARATPDILAACIAKRVVVVPGSGCFHDTEPGTHVRMAFSAVGEDAIDAGVDRFAAALNWA